MSGVDLVQSWTQLALGAGGRSLIEASAGTGKTWTISVLYLRLLLEQDLSPAQIVVTTFTDAAAQELRERVRERIAWAQHEAEAALGGPAITSAVDADARGWLLARWCDNPGGGLAATRAFADLQRLRLAQVELDRAPMGTLHSICRRILADHPFESGSAFELDQAVTPDAINAELMNDLWRQLSQSGSVADADDEVWRKDGRKRLEKYLRLVLMPGVGVATIDPAPIDEVMRIDNAQRLETWIARTQFRSVNAKLRRRLLALAKIIQDGDPSAALPKDIGEVLADPGPYFKPGTTPDATTAQVLAFARRAADVLSTAVYLPRARALARYREQLRARCRERLAASGRMTFDELIERVVRALNADAGTVLADRLFESWPVALVDEFQDTDLQQYAILDRIYRADDSARRGRLVMIGDPKQAIYRFRGGDIDAYLHARTSADSMLALDRNFRSSRQYVRAVNALYARAGAAMSSDAGHPIAYRAVGDSDTRDRMPYCIDGMICERPLHVHYWDGDDLPDSADERVGAALNACASQIVELLSGRYAIGTRSVQPGDIAVLLPTRQQVLALRDALRARNVPCVTSAWSSVFVSPWARELRIALYAALHPRDEGAVRGALATRLGGRTYVQLRDQRDDSEAWQRDAEAFERYEHIWRTRGVLALVQTLTAAAATRLFAGDDGERALSDLRHLGELLQARSEEIAGREELLSWFAQECERPVAEAAEATADERQQRIESDAARVRLMTLHGSKGLEFDIVLLPLMWANRHNFQDDIPVLHDADARARVVSFGDPAMQRYIEEGQNERYRLLYVALTRARYACHVYALPPSRSHGNGRAANAGPERAPLDCLIERLLRSAPLPADIDHVQWSVRRWHRSQESWRPPTAPARERADVLAAPPNPAFEATWSFSALLQGRSVVANEEAAAGDEIGTDVAGADAASAVTVGGEPEHPQLAWLAPVAGADFGNAVHAMFERREIGKPMREQSGLIERCLRDEGVGLRGIAPDELVRHLAARLQATLDAPLLPGTHATLAALPAAAVCAEMPFQFALGEVSLRRLRAVCDFVPPTDAQRLHGLMTGKIDLVFEHRGRFHVLDYKSNRLGGAMRLSDYAAPQLERAMTEGHYRFQALLYSVALHRFLRQRIADYRREQLGEAIYLFVRAVGIAPEVAPRAGIWTQRFDDALIDAVDAVLAGDTVQAA